MKKTTLNHAELKALVGQLSKEKLEELKSTHQYGIYAISAGGHIAYFRNPSRQDINIAASQIDEDNPMDYYETLMRETFIAGSKNIIEDDKLYLGSIDLVKKAASGEKAELVNL